MKPDEGSFLHSVERVIDDAMRNAHGEIREVWRSRDDVPDLGTGAYVGAIGKVVHYYVEYLL